MKKRNLLSITLIGLLLLILGVSSVFGYSNRRYLATCLRGGTTGCLDKINGSILSEGDLAITITASRAYFHTLKISGCGADSDANIIPDNNPGTKCWIEVSGSDTPVTIGTDGQIMVSDGTDVTWVSISGDISITNAGVVALSADTVGPDEMADADHGDGEWLNGFLDIETIRVHAKVNEAGGVVKGQAVYIINATGDKPTVGLADNTLHDKAHTLGIAADTGANNGDIDVILFGELTDVDTHLFAEGARLHLITAGDMQEAVPVNGAHIHMGFVTKSNAESGIMIVHPEAYIHDIRATSDEDVMLATGSTDATRKIIFEDYDGTDIGYADGAGNFNWGTSNAFNITAAGAVTVPGGIDNAIIGGVTPAAGSFTDIILSGDININSTTNDLMEYRLSGFYDPTWDIVTANDVIGATQLENVASLLGGRTEWGISAGPTAITAYSMRAAWAVKNIDAPTCDATCATNDIITATHDFEEDDIVTISETSYTNMVAGTSYAICNVTGTTSFGLDTDADGTPCGGDCSTCSTPLNLVADTPSALVPIYVKSEVAGVNFEVYIPDGSNHVIGISHDEVIATFGAGHDIKWTIMGDGDACFGAACEPSSVTASSDLDLRSGAIAFSSDTIAHGVTDIAPANVAGYVTLGNINQGGIDFWGISENAAISGMLFNSVLVEDPTDTIPAFKFSAYSKSGTGVTAIDGAETAAQFLNHTTSLLTIFGNADINIKGATNNCTLTIDADGTCDAGTAMVVDNSIAICAVCVAN